MMMNFYDVLQSNDYLILDTETTGLDRNAEVCQIAIINAKGEALLNTYVKPNRPIPEVTTRIHGITDEMVKDAPTWPELAAQIEAILSGQHLVIYNASYDLRVLEQSALAWGHALKRDFHSYCVMEEFAPIYGEWEDWRGSFRWQPLTRAAAYYDAETNGAHDALADCHMTLAVCRGLRSRWYTDGAE